MTQASADGAGADWHCCCVKEACVGSLVQDRALGFGGPAGWCLPQHCCRWWGFGKGLGRNRWQQTEQPGAAESVECE